MASNPQAVIEILGFFAGNMDANAKLEKSMDDRTANPPPVPQQKKIGPIPPPPLKKEFGSGDKLAETPKKPGLQQYINNRSKTGFRTEIIWIERCCFARYIKYLKQLL